MGGCRGLCEKNKGLETRKYYFDKNMAAGCRSLAVKAPDGLFLCPIGLHSPLPELCITGIRLLGMQRTRHTNDL